MFMDSSKTCPSINVHRHRVARSLGRSIEGVHTEITLRQPARQVDAG